MSWLVAHTNLQLELRGDYKLNGMLNETNLRKVDVWDKILNL